jgi:ATP/maltotriose-dependent transcriptional regulator MalT
VIIQSMENDDMPPLNAAIDTARARFEAAGDVRGRIGVDVMGLERDFGAGRLTVMLEAGQRLAGEALGIGDRPRAAATYARLVSTAAWLGRGDVADELADRAIAMARELGLNSTLRWAQFFAARLAWMRGDLELAEREVRAVAANAEEAGDLSSVLTANRLLGEVLMDSGRLDEADQALATALDVSIRTGDRWSRTELIAMRADIRLVRGELAEAHRFVAEAQTTLRSEDIAAVAVVESVVGRLAAAEGDDVEAERTLRHALAVSRETEYWWWALNGLELAEFLVSRGRAAEAAPLAGDVDEKLRACAYGIRRARVEAVLRQLAGQPA